MADYYSLIARATAGKETPDERQAVYDRARKALFNQLRSIDPPVPEADIAAEGRALEEAITRLEIDFAKNAAGPGAAKSGGARSGASGGEKPADAAPPARSAEDAWRDTLAATAPAPREPQRPAAPLPRPPKSKRPSMRTLALGAVLVALIAVVGGLAWYLRERPEDLAKLKPAETGAAKGQESGKFGDRVGGAPGGATPRRSTVVPVAQKAELWVASAQEPDKVDRIYNATVVWRLENVGGGPGQPMSSAIRGDVDIPDAKLKLSLLFQKNGDAALSASHTITVTFKPQPGSPLGNVKAIGPIQMRRADAQSGEKVAGIPVPITENNFLIGLMRGDREARNVQLLRSLSVIDLPLQFADNRPATINMEKGASGERVFADAIDSWAR
jgi:hypothetical protein